MLKPSHPAHIPSGLHYTFLQHEAWEVVPAAGGGSSQESFPSFGPKWSTVASKPLLPLRLSTQFVSVTQMVGAAKLTQPS